MSTQGENFQGSFREISLGIRQNTEPGTKRIPKAMRAFSLLEE